MPPQPSAILGGTRFLVTRPEGQASALIDGIRALGGEVTHVPFLAIEPRADVSALEQIASRLNDYHACIFISANAVYCAWPTLSRAGWPASLTAATVGPGTSRALRALGVTQIIMPVHRFDSEGLLSEPYFAENACQGRSFALIRGEGGRDFLAKTLRSRGAQVDEVEAYRRSLHPGALDRLAAWLRNGQDPAANTLIISSSESLQRVMAKADPAIVAALTTQHLLVSHERIAEAARRLGFKHVQTSAGGDDGLLDFLRSYNGTGKTTINDETEAS